jgi:hypothetical protein
MDDLQKADIGRRIQPAYIRQRRRGCVVNCKRIQAGKMHEPVPTLLPQIRYGKTQLSILKKRIHARKKTFTTTCNIDHPCIIQLSSSKNCNIAMFSTKLPRCNPSATKSRIRETSPEPTNAAAALGWDHFSSSCKGATPLPSPQPSPCPHPVELDTKP